MNSGLQAHPNPQKACRLRAHLDASAFSSMQVYFKMAAGLNASIFPCTFRDKNIHLGKVWRMADVFKYHYDGFFLFYLGGRYTTITIPTRPRHGRLTRALTFTLAPVACSIGMLEIH